MPLARFLPLLLFTAVLPAAAQTSPSWQQQVVYDMDIVMHPDRHQMDGLQRLTLTNNSPDTLRQVYYHLYFNAFEPGSMMAERNRHLPDPDGRVVPRIFELGPDEVGYHRVQRLAQDGRPLSWEVDATVLRADLAVPVPPGGATTLEMAFDSQVPLQTRRSGRDNREGIDYSMSQWYPKLANYDGRGWHPDPYVGREFYAPFGTFDVAITLPAEYVVGSTGVLQNPDEIGHGYQTDTTRVYDRQPGDSLTWRFRAENVHDFAWAADPDYLHDRIVDDSLGVVYHLLYQPDVADRWRAMQQWVPALIRYFSGAYGRYPYPQFTVAQAGDGGMEYPMINFITGRRSPGSLLGVTAHEAAHEWFYGALGSNEADYAWMDEGFTSYATTEAVSHVVGRPDPSHQGAVQSVVASQMLGLAEPFNTPADWFRTNAAYGITAYSGGEMILEMLGYVMSDSLRDDFLKAYFDRFRFRHPNPYDIEKVAEDVSGLRLDWFFHQFANTTRRLDYAVDDVDAERVGDAWATTIELEREGDVVVPIDLKLTLEDGSAQWVTIPLGVMQGHKPVPADWIVAEPWFWTFPEYELTVELPQRVVDVEIDPEGRTPDVDRLDNTARFPRRVRFLEPAQPSWFDYGVGYRPLAQYADAFGVGAGLQVRGAYTFDRHEVRAMLKLWPQVLASGGDDPGVDYPTDDVYAFDGVDYELSYATRLPGFGQGARGRLTARKHLGLLVNEAAFTSPLSAVPIFADVDREVGLTVRHLLSYTDRVFRPDGVTPVFFGEHTASAELHYHVEDGADAIRLTASAGASLREGSARNANRFLLDAVKTAGVGPFTGRAALRLGFASEQLVPHRWFRLGGGSWLDAWSDDAYRSLAAVDPEAMTGDVHLAALDGAGPVAYLLAAAEGPQVNQALVPMGTSTVAGTLSLTAAPFARSTWLAPLRVELFSGLGTVWGANSLSADRGFDADNLLADAGVGVRYDVGSLRALRRWTQQSDVLSGLGLVVKLPVWVSDPELIDTDADAFAARWLVGLQVD